MDEFRGGQGTDNGSQICGCRSGRVVCGEGENRIDDMEDTAGEVDILSAKLAVLKKFGRHDTYRCGDCRSRQQPTCENDTGAIGHRFHTLASSHISI